EEYGIPFTLYDAASAEVVCSEDPAEMANPTADWKQKLVLQMASEERASVTPLTDGHYQLVLPLHEGGRLILIALGMLPALTRTQPGAAQEQVRLLKWLQS